LLGLKGTKHAFNEDSDSPNLIVLFGVFGQSLVYFLDGVEVIYFDIQLISQCSFA